MIFTTSKEQSFFSSPDQFCLSAITSKIKSRGRHDASDIKFYMLYPSLDKCFSQVQHHNFASRLIPRCFYVSCLPVGKNKKHFKQAESANDGQAHGNTVSKRKEYSTAICRLSDR